MKNKVMCFIFGHEWKRMTKHYKKTKDRMSFVVTEYNKCLRCGKKEKRVF